MVTVQLSARKQCANTVSLLWQSTLYQVITFEILFVCKWREIVGIKGDIGQGLPELTVVEIIG